MTRGKDAADYAVANPPHAAIAPPSMQLADDGGEGNRKNLATEFIGDAQLPAAPVFGRGRHHEEAHEALGLGIGFGETSDGEAAPVPQDMAGAGAVEIDFSHVPPPSGAIAYSYGGCRGSGFSRACRPRRF